MIISIVNENNKNVKYVIEDRTPELNFSSDSFNVSALFVENKFTKDFKSISYEEFEKYFPYSHIRYNVFIDSLKSNTTIDFDYIEESYNDLNKSFLDYIDTLNVFKFDSEISSIVTSYFLVSYDNNLKISISDDTYISIPDSLQLKNNFYCRSDSYFETFKNKICEISANLDNIENHLKYEYITEIPELVIPDVDEWEYLDVNLDNFIIIPEINEDDYKINDEYFEKFNTDKIFNEINLISSDISKLIDLHDLLSTTISQLDTNINSNIKKIINIKFNCFDANREKPMYVDNILINDVALNENEYIVNYNDDAITYSIIREIESNPYKLTLERTGFLTKELNLRPKYSFDINDVDEFDIGKIPMINIGNLISFYLEWGKYPFDLDLHVYEFSSMFNLISHTYFDNMKTIYSSIVLDADDTDSFGPETVQIFNLNKEKYYLFSIHNFSYYKFQTIENSQFNYENKTNLIIKLNKDKKIKISPYMNYVDSFWFDGFIIHDEKIYVLNKFAFSRNSEPDYIFTNKNDLKELKENFKNSTQIFEIKNLIVN